MRRRFATSAVFAIAACGGTSIERFDPPPLQDATAAIVAVRTEASDDAPALYALSADRFELAFAADDGADVEVAVAGLRESLEALGLETGAFASSPDPSAIALDAFAPAPIVHTRYAGTGWSEWAALDALPPSLARVRIPLVGCSVPLDEMRARFDETVNIAMAEAIDDDRALIVAGARAYIFHADDGLVLDAPLPEPMIGGAIISSLGSTYLGASEGRHLYTLDLPTLNATLTASTSEPDTGGFRWIDGAVSPSERPALTILSTRGKILRLEDGRLSVRAEVHVRGSNTDYGAVHALDAATTLLGADNNPDLFRFDGTTLAAEITGGIDAKGFLGLVRVPELGLVTVEQTTGAVHVRDEGDWREIGRTLTAARLVQATGDGRFIVADEFSSWTEYLPHRGFACETHQSARIITPHHSFRLRDVVYAIGPGQGAFAELVALARVP